MSKRASKGVSTLDEKEEMFIEGLGGVENNNKIREKRKRERVKRMSQRDEKEGRQGIHTIASHHHSTLATHHATTQTHAQPTARLLSFFLSSSVSNVIRTFYFSFFCFFLFFLFI